MAQEVPITLPDCRNIPHSHRLPVNHREVQRTFSKLSRQSLIALAHQWLSKKNRDFCRPYLLRDRDGDKGREGEEQDERYHPAQSCEELQETYKELGARKGGKREMQDRILEGDWRRGISMYQLATAEIQYLLDHPSSLRWTAKRLARIPNARSAVSDMEVTNDSDHLPRFQAQTFMLNLARELTPLMKAHYLLTKIKTLPMTILRVYIHDSPYSTELSLATDTASSTDSARAVFFIWPNGSPFIYSSIANHNGQSIGDDSRHLRDVVQQAIPNAFSRPTVRYQLVSTNFTTKSLDALLAYRGPGRTNGAAGGWNIFADHSFSQNALDFIISQNSPGKEKGKGAIGARPASDVTIRPPKHPLPDADSVETERRRAIAQGRFGTSALPNDSLALERFEVRIDDPFPASLSFNRNTHAQPHVESQPNNHPPATIPEEPAALHHPPSEDNNNNDNWIPNVRFVFTGPHVFAGVRHLVEEGVVDGERMPGWMTGESAVTMGVVRGGRVRTKKGGGV